MKKKKEESKINYLDLIPERAEDLRWHTDFRDRVILEVENTGLMNTIAQRVFGKPRFTKVPVLRVANATSAHQPRNPYVKKMSRIS